MLSLDPVNTTTTIGVSGCFVVVYEVVDFPVDSQGHSVVQAKSKPFKEHTRAKELFANCLEI